MVRASASAMLLGLLAIGPTFAADEPKGGDKKIAAAIDAIRGRDIDKLSAGEQDAFGKRLDEAWKVLTDNPRRAEPQVLAALQSEASDSFRIIDLAHLLIVLDPARQEQAVAPLLKADPNAYADGFFQVAAFMASGHCQPCLPAVLKVLELQKLKSYVPEHALTIEIDLGIVFTLGQYGEAALDGARAGLKSQSCVVRANAAKAIGFLMPLVEPPALPEMIFGDSCGSARAEAWKALGLMNSPSLPGIAKKRLASTPPPDEEERQAMAGALAIDYCPSVTEPLAVLAKDPSPAVAEAASKQLKAVKDAYTPDWLRKKVGSASPAARSRVLEKIRKAVKSGHFDDDGKFEELIQAVTPADFPLLQEARAAVLARVSDECLYEYADLTQAARALRVLQQVRGDDPSEASSRATSPDPSRRR